MRPRVIIHNAVSVDGRIDGFEANLGLYYGLIGRWGEDATLVGSETILTGLAAEQPPEEGEEVVPVPSDGVEGARALLVAVDSRGQLRHWGYLRRQPYWRGVLALVSRATPAEYRQYLEKRGMGYVVSGDERVDLGVALEELNARHGVKTVRVDSGGTLNGALLRAGLVDEVSVVVHPALVGGNGQRSIFRAPDLKVGEGAIAVRLVQLERLEGDVVWLRYEVVK